MHKLRTAFRKYLTLKSFNDVLTGVIVVMALYILLLPILPAVSWWVRHDAPVVSSPRKATVQQVRSEDIPADNTLVIPSIGVREKVLEGESVYTVDKGIWHRPRSSSPDKMSNTVLVGHRFTYHNTPPFYNLDKVRVGDEIGLYWNGKAYTYKVAAIKVVDPQDVSIEQPTANSILTLYTCTPLWTSKQRLVVQASLETVR